MSDSLPTSFKDLKVEELRRSAVEDFAVEVTDKDNKDSVIAALTESGVTWGDYVSQHPEVKPELPPVESNRETEPDRGNVIGAKEVNGEPVENAVPTPPKVRVQEKTFTPEDQYLIKMVRENPLYETRGYRFTQKHPYALVSAADAEYILNNEEGFRQAFPKELEEYYS